MPHSQGLKKNPKGHASFTGTDRHRGHISFTETHAQRPQLFTENDRPGEQTKPDLLGQTSIEATVTERDWQTGHTSITKTQTESPGLLYWD